MHKILYPAIIHINQHNAACEHGSCCHESLSELEHEQKSALFLQNAFKKKTRQKLFLLTGSKIFRNTNTNTLAKSKVK